MVTMTVAVVVRLAVMAVAGEGGSRCGRVRWCCRTAASTAGIVVVVGRRRASGPAAAATATVMLLLRVSRKCGSGPGLSSG